MNFNRIHSFNFSFFAFFSFCWKDQKGSDSGVIGLFSRLWALGFQAIHYLSSVLLLLRIFFFFNKQNVVDKPKLKSERRNKNNIENNIYVKSMNLSSSQVVSVFSHAQQGAAQPLDFLLSLYMTVHLPALGRKKNQIKE